MTVTVTVTTTVTAPHGFHFVVPARNHTTLGGEWAWTVRGCLSNDSLIAFDLETAQGLADVLNVEWNEAVEDAALNG